MICCHGGECPTTARLRFPCRAAGIFDPGLHSTWPPAGRESDALFEAWTIPGPGRPLFEDAAANFSRHSPAAVDTHHAVRGPLLLVSGDEDHTVPSTVTRQVFKLYADNPSVTEYKEFEDRGHSLTMDAGWESVASGALEWLEAQKL
jgi:pimeloyl-ACP methyl ester carboxylesterase